MAQQQQAIEDAVRALVDFDIVEVERDVMRMLYFIRARNLFQSTFYQMEVCAITEYSTTQIEQLAELFASGVPPQLVDPPE